MSPIDDDLVNRLFRQYTETENRIELIKLVKAKQAERMAYTPNMWQRFTSKLKGWFKK